MVGGGNIAKGASVVVGVSEESELEAITASLAFMNTRCLGLRCIGSEGIEADVRDNTEGTGVGEGGGTRAEAGRLVVGD